MERKGEQGEGSVFKDQNEVIMAYENKMISLHTRIAVRATSLPNTIPAELADHYLVTTCGKIIFNTILPKDFPYLNEPDELNLTKETPRKYFLPPGTDIKAAILQVAMPKPFPKKFLSSIIAQIFARYKINETSKMLDKMKNIGFKYSTIAGLTIAASDVQVYSGKEAILAKHDATVQSITEMYQMGLLTNKERANLVIKEWKMAKDEIQDGLKEELKFDNHIRMMSDSGARGNISNFTQLAGMRGLMAKPSGGDIELPIRASFREGLTMSEFFISTHGARKGSTDTALKTAESGYLTRRLVDVSQDVVITEEDCGTDKGVRLKGLKDERDGKTIEALNERLRGRYAAADIINPMTGELLVPRNKYINPDQSKTIESAYQAAEESGMKLTTLDYPMVRTTLTCASKVGICRKCYGQNLATGDKAEVGESVGTIAAQSIGEPGTQLTMRTFHTGGVAGDDITQGLPRVQELFEARTSKGEAIISEINGTVKDIQPLEERFIITISNDIETKRYETNSNVQSLVKKDDDVYAGRQLTEGSIDPKKLLRVTDMETVQEYILKEVQKVYRSQGVDISDKHIEIIVRQMTRRLNVIIEGDTDLLPGSQISVQEFIEANRQVLKDGKRPAIAKPVLLGITKASLRSDSFLSAASFQETTRVLTDAAIRGKIDPLLGLKENVIIGGLIPAGTGILRHTQLEYEVPETEEEDLYADFEE
jgi:DNA-directed RNA polymerase subunit beta'